METSLLVSAGGGQPHKPVLPPQPLPGSQSVVGPSQGPPPINPAHSYQVTAEQPPSCCFLPPAFWQALRTWCLCLPLENVWRCICMHLICFLQNQPPLTPAQVAAQMAVDAANNQKSRCKLTGGAKLLRIINFCQAMFCFFFPVYLPCLGFSSPLENPVMFEMFTSHFTLCFCKGLRLLMCRTYTFSLQKYTQS